MFRPTVAQLGTAILLAAVDLAHKAMSGTEHVHERSAAYVVVVIVLLTAWAIAILAARSLSLALGGGVAAGGALGNLASLALWPGVPNPLTVDAIAFNLADVFVLAGFVLVAGSALAVATRSPERLREPVRLH